MIRSCHVVDHAGVSVCDLRGAIMQAAGVGTLEDLNIDNSFVTELPGDPETTNVPRQVYGALWTPGAARAFVCAERLN